VPEGLPPVDWATVADKLEAGSAPAPDAVNARTTWLSTVNQDGSPHVTPVGALLADAADETVVVRGEPVENRLKAVRLERHVAQPQFVVHGVVRTRFVVWADEARQF
jgi:hypothetical protein